MTTGSASTRISLNLERTPYGDFEAEMPAADITSIGLHLQGRCRLEWGIGGPHQIGRPSTGQMTLIPRGQSGSLRVTSTGCEILKIGITDAAMAAWAVGTETPLRTDPLVDRFAVTDPFVHQVSLTLLREIERPGTVDLIYRDALSNALLAHLVRRHSALDAAAPLSRQVHALSQRRARLAVEFMEASMTSTIGLDDIARELGLSTSHFAAQFRERFGQSPARYLNWLRLERACELLKTTPLPISVIAARVGFASPSHFSKSFSQTYGATPTSHRAAFG